MPKTLTKKAKHPGLEEWALQITALRERLGINQAELARRMECSAMTISRWERGLLQPSAEHFIQLGNIDDKSAWFFWERAGIQPAKMAGALKGSGRKRENEAHLEAAAASRKHARPGKMSETVNLPLLKAVAGTHGVAGDRRSSLRSIPASKLVGAPAAWCPNPEYTSLLRVKGRSMEPLIRDRDILAVDSYQTDRNLLYGKVVMATNEQNGLCVSRLRHCASFDLLEGENREHGPVLLNKASGWRIVGRVLWWISAAP